MSCCTDFSSFDVPYQDNAVFTFDIKDADGVVVDLTGKTYALKIYDLLGNLVTTLAGTVDTEENTFTFTLTTLFWAKLSKNTPYKAYMKETTGGLTVSVPPYSIPFNVI